MHHALDSLKRKYEAVRKEWEDDSRKRRRLRKRCPVEYRQDPGTAPKGHKQYEASRAAVESALGRQEGSMRILRRHLTAECTISILCPAVGGVHLTGDRYATSAAAEACDEQDAAQDLSHHNLESADPAALSVVEGTHATEQVSLEGLPLLTASPPPAAQQSASEPTTLRIDTDSHLTTYPLAPEEEPPANEHQLSPPQELPGAPHVVPLPSLDNPSSSHPVTAIATKAPAGTHVNRIHTWLHTLDAGSAAAP